MPLSSRGRWLLQALALIVASRASAQGVPLRVMTYNIQSGHGDLAATAAAIDSQRPDVVGLQEVDVHWASRSGFADQASELAARLHMDARFARIYHIVGDSGRPPREFGVALLSKYPIVRWQNDTLTRLSTQEANPSPTPMPGLLEAFIDIHGHMVRVFDTHLDYRADPRVRQRQVAEMVAYLASDSLPTIVLGDLNASPDAPELAPLLTRLHDAWTGAPDSSYTYPADQPRALDDYVLVSNAFAVRGARVPATLASDHRPIVADLVLRESGKP